VGDEERAVGAFVEPRTDTERELAALWSKILRVPRVGSSDDFFALGGDSMLAAELVARLRELRDRPDLPLTCLVWAPTLGQLAAELDGPPRKQPESLVVPIQTGDTHPPVFFVHALDGEIVRFPALARRLGADQSFYGVRARGLNGDEPPHENRDAMVRDYVDQVRAVQPRGPYFLGGICLGAPIAMEMAKRLQAAGEGVALLTMIDPRVPARKDRTWIGWQLRLAGRKMRSGDYSRGLLRPARQREVWGPVAAGLRRAVGGDIDPSREAFERRMREIRRQGVVSRYSGDVLLVVTVDYPLREWFWRPLIDGRLEVEEIPFRHTTALRSPAVELVADRLRRAVKDSR
jgi:thioesterase domain-containing protein